MKVLPTCGKSTVECQSFMVLDILVPIPSSSSTAEGSNHTDLKPSTYYRWSDVHQSVREFVDFPTPREELPSTQMDTTYPQTHI